MANRILDVSFSEPAPAGEIFRRLLEAIGECVEHNESNCTGFRLQETLEL